MKRFVVVLGLALLVLAACQPSASPTPTATPTPSPTGTAAPVRGAPTATPTPTPPSPGPGAPPTPTAPTSQCDGLSGEIEVQVLVGPAEVVGLEPHAVGEVPFSVTGGAGTYVVQGGGAISYADILVEEWGTYAVTMDLQVTITGECVGVAGDERLRVTLEMSGEQMVEVTAEGFHGEYPWAGTHSFDLTFPLVEGATAQGEGWSFVLYPHSR